MKDHLQDVLKNADTEYAEIRIEKTTSTRITFTGSDIEDCSQNVSFGGNVRALHKGAWGFTCFNSLEEIPQKVTIALNHAKSLGERLNKSFKLAEVPVVQVEIPLEVKNNSYDVPLEEKLGILKGYNEIILGTEKITTSQVRYFDNHRNISFISTDGNYVSRKSMDIGFAASAIVANADGSHMSYVMKGSSNDFNVARGLDEQVRAACTTTVGVSEADQVDGGEYVVILDPTLAGVFIHEAFGHLSEGDNIYEDPSLQKVMVLGREFGGQHLNVIDSGLEKGLRGYIPYDDEGVATERTYLIKEGKLVGRLHSRETAAKMGEQPTGSARAMSFQQPPIPRMRITMIEAGNVPFEEMVKSTKKGLYCINARGGQTNGELFTFTAMDAFMIRDGRIAERVRDVTLSGNVFETLKNIDMIGNDYLAFDGPGGCGKRGQFPLPVSEGSPHVRIQNVVVGGK